MLYDKSSGEAKESAHWSSSSMGMSANVFQRSILASRLSNGRGPVLGTFDLELLLRTMMQKTKERCALAQRKQIGDLYEIT
jgi:hypothetical protein